MDLFETEWDIAYRTGRENEQERIVQMLEHLRGRSLTTDDLIYLVTKVQPHAPEHFRHRSNGE
jgi:hypothetical protein